MESKEGSHKILHMATVPEFLFFLEKQLDFMKKNGFDVHVLSSPGKDFDEFVEMEGVIPYEVEMERDISVWKDIRSLWKIWRVLRKYRFDIVHVHTPKAGLLGMIAATLAGVKVRIYHMHGLTYTTRTGLNRKILYFSEKLTCLLSHKTYAVSSSLLKYVVDDGIIPKQKIRLIQNGSINGLDCDTRFNRTRYPDSKLHNTYGINENDFVLGFVGRIVRDKGIVELVEAYRALKKSYDHVKMLVVGQLENVDSLPKDVWREIEEDDCIIYVGSVDNPAPYYSLMDVLVLPTYREGFGLVAIEAMAMGVPVIASRVLGCVDTIEHGKNGFLVPAQNVEQIVEKVQFYMENNEDRDRHGDYGRSMVKQKYDQSAIWKDQLRDYQLLVKKI